MGLSKKITEETLDMLSKQIYKWFPINTNFEEFSDIFIAIHSETLKNIAMEISFLTRVLCASSQRSLSALIVAIDVDDYAKQIISNSVENIKINIKKIIDFHSNNNKISFNDNIYIGVPTRYPNQTWKELSNEKVSKNLKNKILDLFKK